MADPIQAAPPTRMWKLTIAYDGAGYHGWQVQPGKPTIQGELQAALGRITGESPLPQGSGRTDAGVHALAQIASFPLLAPIPAENLQRALNRTLPPSIRVTAAETADGNFHARHSAVSKTYEYRIFRGEICPPFLAPYVYPCPWPLNLDALAASAGVFLGVHDFRSFAATDPDLATREAAAGTQDDAPEPARTTIRTSARTTVRTIFSSVWEESSTWEERSIGEERATEAGNLLVYRVRGDGFLHHMVRNLVGTMLDAARGHLRVDELHGILAARSRSAAGPTAPARGLFLHSVVYGPDK